MYFGLYDTLPHIYLDKMMDNRKKLRAPRHAHPTTLPPQFTESLNPNHFNFGANPTIPTTPIPPQNPQPTGSFEPLSDALKDLNLGTDNKPPKTPGNGLILLLLTIFSQKHYAICWV